MTIKNPKRANEERKAFSDADLSRLFSSDLYTQKTFKHSYYFWLPLLALYTGARLNELCQLHLVDFETIDGIEIFRISDLDGVKKVKTKAGRRIIPLHPKLIQMGILDLVTKLRKRGEVRLFPELKLTRDGYGQAASKWFARYAKSCGVDEQGKVFHSFRHTVVDCLKQAGVPREKIAALVGHEDETETFGRYGKDFNSKVMKEVIEVLGFDVVTTKSTD